MNEILSYTTMEPGDLIDFETVVENPTLETTRETEEKWLARPRFCNWLKIGKDERCWKPCKGDFCHVHRRLIRNGATILISCFGCNVGITRWHYLCAHCEKYSGL